MRPTREQTFLALAEVFSLRGTCPRAKVGCVIVDSTHVVAHGYNGAPRGLPHCDDEAIIPPDHMALRGHFCNAAAPGQGCTNAVHAEENAIAYAARMGVKTNGCAMYTTHEPCLRCSRLIIQAGIWKVVYCKPYRVHDGIELLKSAGVEVRWNYIDVAVTLGA